MKREDSEFNLELLSKNLNERVKELACLFKISKIARSHKESLSDTLTAIVKVIPEGWQYPEKIRACIRYDHKVYGNPLVSDFHQSTQFTVDGKVGDLVVFYKNKYDIPFGDSFLHEEQELINQIGLELESIIELHEKNEREKLINDRLRYNDKLTLLGEISAGIAHELNTPLANVLGYSQLMLSKEANTERKLNLEKIVKSSLQAREIVKKLMFFSCEMPTQFKELSVNDLIVESLDLLKLQLQDSKVELILNLPEKSPKLLVDAIQISQVIFNIVLNALGAMKNGGKLEITVRETKGKIYIEFKDTGKGIPEEVLPKIFEPFYTTKEIGEGTGLGLSVSYGIVQAHKGKIEVASVLGEGTTFKLIFNVVNNS